MKHSFKSFEKKWRKEIKKQVSRGKKFSKKNPYGIIFTLFTFATMAIAICEYIRSDYDRFLAEQPKFAREVGRPRKLENTDSIARHYRFPR